MSSTASGVRTLLYDAAKAAIDSGDLQPEKSGRLSVTVEALKPLRRVGQEEIDRLGAGILTLMISPGYRFVAPEDRESFRRVVGVKFTIAMRLRKHALASDFDACEQFVELLEAWLWDRGNKPTEPLAVFDDLLDTPESRLPYDQELMESDVFAAAIAVDYEVP